MVDNAQIYFSLILACTLALCCVEIYIKINSYWLSIKFIPLSPKLFSLVLLSLPLSNHCLSALWGISRKPPNSPTRFASTPRQLSKPPVIQIGQEMSDGGSNPNRFAGYGWMTREVAEEGNLPEGCPWSKKVSVSFWKLAKWLWHWALSLWPSVVSLSVRSATTFPLQPWY